VLALAAESAEIHALSFRYGQRHACELAAARGLADAYAVASYRVIDVDFALPGASALTDPQVAVPKHDSCDDIGDDIPVTYVPARNTIFLAYGVAVAEMVEAKEIHVGVNALDYSGYPDCRPEYVEAFEKMANLATKAGVEGNGLKIVAPLIHLTKAEIIKLGVANGVDYSLTHSCYAPNEQGLACGHCDSCLLRRRGFRDAGVPDPTSYFETPAE
jgi:7-cyano-7-deazaguanine synthase